MSYDKYLQRQLRYGGNEAALAAAQKLVSKQTLFEANPLQLINNSALVGGTATTFDWHQTPDPELTTEDFESVDGTIICRRSGLYHLYAYVDYTVAWPTTPAAGTHVGGRYYFSVNDESNAPGYWFYPQWVVAPPVTFGHVSMSYPHPLTAGDTVDFVASQNNGIGSLPTDLDFGSAYLLLTPLG